MSDTGRLHRVDPVRTGPIRNFSNLYKQPGASAAQSRSETRSPQPADAPNGRYADGVATAYSVLEKHINEGRATAQQFSRPAYDTSTAVDGIQKLIEESLRYQVEMLPLLIETLTSLMPSNGSGGSSSPDLWPQRPVNNAQSSSPPVNGGQATVVSLELASRQPVEVTLNLSDYSNIADLVSPGLHSIDPGHPPLTDLGFSEGGEAGRVKLRIVVPDNQPSGLYSGVIISRSSGLLRGTLTVRVA
jgi:hypothetical protein